MLKHGKNLQKKKQINCLAIIIFRFNLQKKGIWCNRLVIYVYSVGRNTCQPQFCKQITGERCTTWTHRQQKKIQDGKQKIEDILMFSFWLFTEMLNRISCRLLN